MKSPFLPLLALVLLAVVSQAAPPKSELRTVNGKVYNAISAPRWETVPPEFSNGYLYSCVVAAVLAEGMACDISTSQYSESRGYRDNGHLKYILVKNHPLQSSAVTGTSVSQFRAMPIGRSQLFGSTVTVYDCGTPYQPPPPSAIDKLASEILAENRKASADAAALQFHLERAKSGNPSSQLRLVELYTQRGDTNSAALWQSAARTNSP